MTATPKMKNNTTDLSAARNPAPLLVLALCAPLCNAAEDVPAGPAPEEPSVITAPSVDTAPALQMSTDYAHPALGFSAYMPIGQVQGRAIRVEPFTVRAGVQTGIGYDDNVALSSTNRQGSMFVTVSPSVVVGLEGPNQRYYAAYRGNYGNFASDAQNDYADHNLALNAAHEFTGRLRTAARYDFVRGHTPRGATSTSTTGSEKLTQQTIGGTVNYGAPGAQGGLQGDVGYSTRRFSGSGASGFAEYDRIDASGTFYYRVAPKTRALIQATRADIEHPRDSSLDNTETRLQVGVTWEALAATRGRVAVGYTAKDFTSREDFTGGSFEAGVTWAPRAYSTVDVSAQRFLAESYEIGSSFTVNTVSSISWRHIWPSGLLSTVNYLYGHVEQEGLNRSDTYRNFGARVSYPLRRSIRLGAEFRHDVRDSGGGVLDYSRNLILLTLETAL